MSRLQLALNVSNLDEAIAFYSQLFSSPPAKVRPGYANFAIADPPLKLVLIEHADGRGKGVAGALNHLGVEVQDPAEVAQASARLAADGLETLDQEQTTCCYAVQDKVWVDDPDGDAVGDLHRARGRAGGIGPRRRRNLLRQHRDRFVAGQGLARRVLLNGSHRSPGGRRE